MSEIRDTDTVFNRDLTTRPDATKTVTTSNIGQDNGIGKTTRPRETTQVLTTRFNAHTFIYFSTRPQKF